VTAARPNHHLTVVRVPFEEGLAVEVARIRAAHEAGQRLRRVEGQLGALLRHPASPAPAEAAPVALDPPRVDVPARADRLVDLGYAALLFALGFLSGCAFAGFA
jgi:hypothetical protein